MTHDHFNPNRFADSAGVPWQGRAFEANPFSNDDGAARPELIKAIEEFQRSGDAREVFQEFCKSRLLIPLVAALGETAEGVQGLTADKSAELSIVTVSAPDGATALPVFSSTATMAAWNPQARPVPADAARVALAAAAEGNTRVVLDPTSPSEFVFRRPAIAAIAQGHFWIPPHLDGELHSAVSTSALLDGVIAVDFATEDPRSRLQGVELIIELTIRPGLNQLQLDSLLANVTTALSKIQILADRVDELKLVVKAAI